MKNNNIKAVIFDIDGVLLDSFEANLKFFQNLMTEFNYKPPTRENFKETFHLSMLDVVKYFTNSTDEEEINKIWEAGRDRGSLYPMELLKIPENVELVLEELNKNYLLGLATSRVKESIYSIPQLAKLEKYFKVAISFCDTVRHKPYPDPLLKAAGKLGIKPEQCVYIGDLESDMLAAKAAGMKIIIYSKDKVDGADYQTSSFEEIIELVKKC
ncbi:MAG: HAD family hydrolase [Patescibacteria group bacterium]|nr:HAD family hydrolase [Patescibacteria group bacterium]MDD4304730.1 HAD family hydrolase [Patescibacteria group bacterium]MDD4695515.1 HAD family hydrolase [Patescibacteria group bacterium]